MLNKSLSKETIKMSDQDLHHWEIFMRHMRSAAETHGEYPVTRWTRVF